MSVQPQTHQLEGILDTLKELGDQEFTKSTMPEEDEVSFAEATDESSQSTYEKQVESLQAYLKALPYECESPEEMQRVLERIISTICTAAKAKNWMVLTPWDGVLQWQVYLTTRFRSLSYFYSCSWLLLGYPIHKPTRAKLVSLYYELCCLPGIEVRMTRSWADMLSRLLSNKSGAHRKLETADLQLSWKPLWRALQKELWPKASAADPQRNLVNILLYVAEQCKRYYPAEDIPEMLNTFIPTLTHDTLLITIPVLTSFLPPANANLYLPAIFRIWEAFNSSIVDDRLLEMCGDLAEEHVAGKAGIAGEYSLEWQDVGIWTQSQWSFLTGKALGSLSVPIGMMKNSGLNTTQHADLAIKDLHRAKIKKSINRMAAIAKLFVYSMRVDGELRQDSPPARGSGTSVFPKQSGFIAGSRALDTLERLIDSTETFFHPSNLGNWTPGLTSLAQRLSLEFLRRSKEQEQPTSLVPESHRLTPQIRRQFVKILRTPVLLAMFSKDANSAAYAASTLRSLAFLEPDLIMPELLERAYGGLEVVNETHRTTAVLSALSVVAGQLVTERIWLGGQKHLVPLLELCLPGIDLNDPGKTICAAKFINNVMMNVKIGDLSASHSTGTFDDGMEVDEHVDPIPDGTEYGGPAVLSREEERSLTRDSTSAFADWVVTLFRRVFSLYENLPEEGGKKNTTGGKSEEAALASIKSMLDLVCQHLSEPLFDLVLKLVYDYGTTNAKSNAVRAFGQLIGCLSKSRPQKTIDKFLPFCIAQIEEELAHGASSIRTTSTHAAIPSDTTLHWNLSILRGCLGYGGSAMLKHKTEIVRVLKLLVDKTKTERGYTSTGRLITRILGAINSIYALSSRFVNDDEWNDSVFEGSHNLHWGKVYNPKDIVTNWHRPSVEEVDFVLEILETIQKPTLDVVESLLADTSRWDSVARNDFCRYLHACRSVWMPLTTFIKLPQPNVVNPCITEAYEVQAMLVSAIDVNCGFTLTDPQDPRYQRVLGYRERFGQIILRAASLLRQNTGGEDHLDAVITVTRSIDTYLLGYGASRGDYEQHQKAYRAVRDLTKTWTGQTEVSRIVYLKRAQLFHISRVYMQSLFRGRSELDDKLIMELVELSISQYSRTRRQAQSTLFNVTVHYMRSTRLILPRVFDALGKGNDPDSMKGALYVLWNKGTAAYALADQELHKSYLVKVLECQHEEKPSVQKMVNNVAVESCSQVNEEQIHTDTYGDDISRVDAAVDDLISELTSTSIDAALLKEIVEKTQLRHAKRHAVWNDTVTAILEIALRPTTHWRYVLLAARLLTHLLRRDVAPPPAVAKFFTEQLVSPQPPIRAQAQVAVCRLLHHVKIRSFSRSNADRWFAEWKNPLRKTIEIDNAESFLQLLQKPVSESGYFVDKLETGFLAWARTITVYTPGDNNVPVALDPSSTPVLQAIHGVLSQDGFISQLASLWGQESGKSNTTLALRTENVLVIKYIGKVFGFAPIEKMLEVTDTLVFDPDKFKQRAAAEFLLGILRGSKHWPKNTSDKVWEWVANRLGSIYAQIKPDTAVFWQHLFSEQLANRDPRRNQVLVDWMLHIPIDFSGESAFEMMKSVTLINSLVDGLKVFFNPHAPRYIDMFFSNANTDYAEVRAYLCHNLLLMQRNLWRPGYDSTESFLRACRESTDPLQIREQLGKIIEKFPQWREERLPPPRVSQSQYDKVGLAILSWIWLSSYSPSAHLIIPYIVPLLPEILRMSEQSDSPELQAYSSGVLYILSALTPLPDYVDPILDKFVEIIESSSSWKTRLHGLPALVIFFYRNLLLLTQDHVSKVTRVLLECLSNENVEVREMASKVLSGVIKTTQRQNIIPLKNRFVALAKKTKLPDRRDPGYAAALRTLHSAILGVCSLVESFPYSVEPWLPPLTEVLAPHATDPPPISTTIRNCASEFKKTHQDTWHKDQLAFDEDQLQSLSTMLVGTSYYA
ncbi:hypothetical protein H1R20_g8194, partial [Candolleomyces eurysporus]